MAFLRIVRLAGSGGGTTSGSASTYVGEIGDIWADDVDFNTLRRGDGVTPGGIIITDSPTIISDLTSTDSPDDGIITPDTGGNVALGTNSLNSVTTGAHNSALGFDALTSNTTGFDNVAIGKDAMRLNTTGYAMTAVGHGALESHTGSGQPRNTALGWFALGLNETGVWNTAVGDAVLYNNIGGTGYEGNYNTGVGTLALLKNTTGYSNTGIGAGALWENTTGYRNTSIGIDALRYNLDGHHNTALGIKSLEENTSGTYNTAVGEHVLNKNIDGIKNTAIGGYSLFNNVSGTSNTVIGVTAGRDVTGSGNVLLGFEAGKTQTAISDKLYISNSDTNNLITGDFSTGTVTFNDAYTFPTADGTASQVLTSDGAGNLSWANETITLSTLKSITAASSDFADFQTRIAAL